MPKLARDSASLSAKLAAIRAHYRTSPPGMVADIAQAVLGAVPNDLLMREVSLLREIEALAGVIAAAKTEIEALRVDDINASHIPSATDELDAIVAHTALATEVILETCEALDQVAAGVGAPYAGHIQEATTRIYEACGFQDITGQRITKVVQTLKRIEAKVAQIISTFAPAPQAQRCPPAAMAPAAAGEADLLNGPQLPGLAMAQSEIDRLLAELE
jgi:chemotaxis protein CheZ